MKTATEIINKYRTKLNDEPFFREGEEMWCEEELVLIIEELIETAKEEIKEAFGNGHLQGEMDMRNYFNNKIKERIEYLEIQKGIHKNNLEFFIRIDELKNLE